GREMQLIVGPAPQPCSDRGGLVSGVVVHNDVNVEAIGNLSVDLLQEIEKLGGAMPLVALAYDEARGNIEGCKKRRRAMTNVGMGPALRHARHHRQDGLLAVEGLDLALLIDAQH